MLDAVHSEELGVPAAAILTEPFAATGEAIAELQGFTDYPFATVPHPIGSLTTAEATSVANAVTPTVLHLLTAATQPGRHSDLASGDAQLARDEPLTDGDAQPVRSSEAASADESRAPATRVAPANVVEELAAFLRADRADLTASITGRHITLSLHIPDEACAECVLPATMLMPMFQNRFDSELGPGWTITLDDPREPEHSNP